jgi:MraZ protein
MHLGSNAINMDAKGRLAIPAKVRDALLSECGGRVVVTAHTEQRCLLIYPEQQWQLLLPQIESLPNINRKAAKMQRVLLGYATNLEIDESHGRILLPPTLREYAGLEKKLMLVGQGKKLELWSEKEWLKYLNDDDDDGEAVPAEVLTLCL